MRMSCEGVTNFIIGPEYKGGYEGVIPIQRRQREITHLQEVVAIAKRRGNIGEEIRMDTIEALIVVQDVTEVEIAP